MALEYKYDQGQIRVKSSDSKGKLCWYLLILVILLNLGAAGWLYFSGYLTTVDDNAENSFATSLRGKLNEQKNLLGKRKQTIEELTHQVGILKREQKIQAIANEELNAKLQLAEKDIGEAHEELLLYGNILNKKDLKQGLHIQHFSLKPVNVNKDGKKINHNRRFAYRIVLSHIRSDDKAAIKGDFLITISGKKSGKSSKLAHKNIVPEGEGNALTGFSLKYYQNLDGEIELPEDFSPDKVRLIVNPSKGKSLEKNQSWSTVMETN